MYQKIILLGTVGKADYKQIGSGSELTSFSLVVNKSWKTKEGKWEQQATWFNCNYWRIDERIKKGVNCFIEGEIEFGEYENKDGVKVKTTKVRVNKIRVLAPKKQEEESRMADTYAPGEIPF